MAFAELREFERSSRQLVSALASAAGATSGTDQLLQQAAPAGEQHRLCCWSLCLVVYLQSQLEGLSCQNRHLNSLQFQLLLLLARQEGLQEEAEADHEAEVVAEAGLAGRQMLLATRFHALIRLHSWLRVQLLLMTTIQWQPSETHRATLVLNQAALLQTQVRVSNSSTLDPRLRLHSKQGSNTTAKHHGVVAGTEEQDRGLMGVS